MLEPHPWTSPYPVHDPEILERDDYAVQRTVFENEKKHKGKQKQREQLSVFTYRFHAILPCSPDLPFCKSQVRLLQNSGIRLFFELCLIHLVGFLGQLIAASCFPFCYEFIEIIERNFTANNLSEVLLHKRSKVSLVLAIGWQR